MVPVRERANVGGILARLAHPERNFIPRLGVLCVQIDKDIASLLPGKRYAYGLVVAAKSPEGQAQFLDLQPGDIIVAANTLPVAFIGPCNPWWTT
jgi:S1-C subfamily serine protease